MRHCLHIFCFLFQSKTEHITWQDTDGKICASGFKIF